MINRITLLLFIGLVWGQLEVRSEYPFESKIIFSNDAQEIIVEGSFHCTNDDSCFIITKSGNNFYYSLIGIDILELKDALDKVINYKFRPNDTQIAFKLSNTKVQVHKTGQNGKVKIGNGSYGDGTQFYNGLLEWIRELEG